MLVDDHRMTRDGLRAVLKENVDFEVIGEAGNGSEALQMAQQLLPDVVVMDICMPGLNGIEATRRITADNPDVKVIALSTYADKRYVLETLEVGAVGYITKVAASDELLRAIRAVVRGKKYLGDDVTGVVVDGYVGRLFPADDLAHSMLSSREREVVQLLAEGRSSTQIAVRLKISPNTVETHRRNIMKKLDLHTVADLTKYAVREGLTPLER
jgi:DNA-binding NarL/FixJ family response regulator